MANAKKLIDLVKAELKKTDDQKALESIVEKVEDNQMLFQNEIHQAKKEVKAREKVCESLEKNLVATPQQIIEAELRLKEAVVILEKMEEINSRRF